MFEVGLYSDKVSRLEALMNMLRMSLMVFGVAVAGAAITAQSGAQATFLGHDKVAGCVKAGTFVTAPDVRVQCSNRTGPGVVEVHLNETDVMYFIDGSATLVTGGKTVGGKSEKDPLQIRGTSIEGGESRQVTKGDVVVVPAGVPHWFKEVPKSVAYFVVKAVTPK